MGQEYKVIIPIAAKHGYEVTAEELDALYENLGRSPAGLHLSAEPSLSPLEL